jgi:hypothetical protein
MELISPLDIQEELCGNQPLKYVLKHAITIEAKIDFF